MESKASTARRDLEQLLVDETAEPKPIPLSLLEEITSDFSDEIGRGGFAVIYKGILGDRVVAVKKLSDDLMDENKFHREVECLMRVKHKNVVRFLGYCADRQGNMARYEGKLVMADVHQRLLCFEYIPKGSLDKYIINPHREWGICYKIIKGICEGLHNLHEIGIVHLDLKPANIMLDDNMSPKITDFGLSRCFNDNQTREITKNILGTFGYMPPEFMEMGVITRSGDLYSLGVIIIEILTGQRGDLATEDVLESWRDRIERSQQETHCEQIRVCYEIALECRDFNPMKRPASALNIIDRLHQTEGFLIGMALGRDVQIRMAGQLNEQSSREALPSLLIQVPSRTIPGFDCVGSDTSTCSLSLHETNKETVITIPAPATPPPADPVPAYDDTQIPYSLSLSMPASPSGFRAASAHRDEARVAAVETTPARQAEARAKRFDTPWTSTPRSPRYPRRPTRFRAPPTATLTPSTLSGGRKYQGEPGSAAPPYLAVHYFVSMH